MLGQERLYGGGCFLLRGLVPKVVRKMTEIRCVVGFRTNLQLIVLKILMVVSCEESGFVGCVLLESAFFVGSGKIVRWWMFCVVRSGSESGSEDG